MTKEARICFEVKIVPSISDIEVVTGQIHTKNEIEPLTPY